MRNVVFPGLIFVAACLPLGAQSTPTTNVISGCVSDLTGIFREVPNANYCLKGLETFQQFNITGPQGPQGIQGPAGPMGAQGVVGPAGPAGAKGTTGSTGAAGAQGPAGPVGATGSQGPMGVAGVVGATGSQGPAGATGPQGTIGLTGATGAQGPIGSTGAAGAMGAQGSIGATGATGPAGPVGATGLQGSVGTSGANGTQGLAGPVGPAGPAGPVGATGPQGPAGGLVWSANLQLPTSISSGEVDLGALSGFGPTVLPTAIFTGESSSLTSTVSDAVLQVPVACTITNFTVTVAYLRGLGTVDANLVIYGNNLFIPGTSSTASSCTVSSGPTIAPASCSGNTGTYLPQGAYIALSLQNYTSPSSFDSAHVLTSLSCQ